MALLNYTNTLWILAISVVSLLFTIYTNYDPVTIDKSINIWQLFKESREAQENYKLFPFWVENAMLKPSTNSYCDPYFPRPLDIPGGSEQIGKENATILVLCRNWELPGILKSMRSLEDRFNKNYHYPWTFINDVPFSEEFKLQTSAMASGKTEYGFIPPSDWDVPENINTTKYDECVKNMVENDVIYGHSRSYRNMCRFNSGYFFRQEIVQKYKWYFRVEPDVEYFCDFQMDPFEVLRVNKKKYGFVISILEYVDTIPTLWDTIEGFMKKYPQYIHPNNSIEFVTNKDPIGFTAVPEYNNMYNLCHFWSNFEIGDLEFFNSEPYLKYFEHLDEAGGFYYERWGDAPVHSLGLSILMDKNEIYNFEDIGYYHVPFSTCPESDPIRINKRCICKESTNYTNINLNPHSCLSRFWRHGGGKTFLKDIFKPEEYFDHEELENLQLLENV
ncbi:hypothetical protein B5S30_g1992 [[Candida] boidinii]|nr:hypothetical protein B5S30_g1992 [[Candida] boidinii]